MKRSIVSLAASVGLFASIGAAAPAHAAFVTFASGTGTDTGNCDSVAAACRQISFALTKTDSGGVVHVLPGEYDAFVIPDNLSVGIIAEGGLASVLNGSVPIPGGGVASILINNTVSANVVRIRGLQIESFGAPIAVVGNETTVHIERCVLAPLAGSIGVDFRPSGTLITRLFVSDTIISRQVGARDATGIRIRPTDSAGISAVLDNVRIEDLGSGILIDGRSTTGSDAITIRDTVISGSATFGLKVVDDSSGSTSVSLEGSTVSNNVTNGVVAVRANTTVRVSNSIVTGNANGLVATSGGNFISQGGNVVRGNTVNGTFTLTEAQQ